MNGDSGAVIGTATARLNKSGTNSKSDSKSSNNNKSNLPATAASLMAIGAVAAGAAFVAFGGIELIRSRKKDTPTDEG
jgi:hypothetical protein